MRFIQTKKQRFIYFQPLHIIDAHSQSIQFGLGSHKQGIIHGAIQRWIVSVTPWSTVALPGYPQNNLGLHEVGCYKLKIDVTFSKEAEIWVDQLCVTIFNPYYLISAKIHWTLRFYLSSLLPSYCLIVILSVDLVVYKLVSTLLRIQLMIQSNQKNLCLLKPLLVEPLPLPTQKRFKTESLKDATGAAPKKAKPQTIYECMVHLRHALNTLHVD